MVYTRFLAESSIRISQGYNQRPIWAAPLSGAQAPFPSSCGSWQNSVPGNSGTYVSVFLLFIGCCSQLLETAHSSLPCSCFNRSSLNMAARFSRVSKTQTHPTVSYLTPSYSAQHCIHTHTHTHTHTPIW